MVKMQRQTIGGSNPIHEQSFQGRTLETSRCKVRGSDLTSKMALLKVRPGASATANSNMQETSSLPPCNQMCIKPLESHETQHLEGPMSMDTRVEVVQKKCAPTLWRTGTRPMVVGTWRTSYQMAIGIQQTGIKPTAIGTRCSSDSLDTEATRSCQRKMTKMQRTRIRPMAIGTQRTNSSS